MNFGNFFTELKRRNVYKVAVAYGIVAWLLIQVATQIFPFFEIPNWAVRLVVLLLVLGFPVAVVLAWIFELTPAGLQRTEEIAPHESIARQTGRKLDFGIIAVLLAVIAVLIFRSRHEPKAASEIGAAEKSVAVLPFENLSGDPENAYFAEGMQDEILARLTKIAALKVVSRMSTQRYKSSPQNLKEIAKALGVEHILEGSVQKVHDQVRVNVQLIKAANEAHLWAETYDRKLTDIFTVESDVAKAIAESLQTTLTGREQRAVEAEPTKNPAAYDAYLRARQLETNPDTLLQNFKMAEQLYIRAVTLDPAFALAHARLAQTSAEIFHFHERTQSWKAKAKTEAEEALRLQPDLAEAHHALGLYFYWIEGDYDRALQEFATAARLAPGAIEPDFLVAAIRRRQGRWRDALAAYNRIAALDPQNPNIARNLVYTNTGLRAWPAAAEAAERWRALAPDSVAAKIQAGYVEFWWRGGTALLKTELGKIAAGVDPDGVVTAARWDVAMIDRDYAAAEKALVDCPLEQLSYLKIQPTAKGFLLGALAVAQGDAAAAKAPLESARAKFEAAVQEAPTNAERHANLGLLYAFLGRHEEAIREGLRAVELKPESTDALDGTVMNCYLALIYARAAEPALAFSLLERLLQAPGAVDSADYSITINDLKFRWEWDPLRNDPQFQKLIEGQ